MNIVKLQDDLKNVPDNALVGYVQNPSGQVPSYLALSELQRRKKMREQATGAQAQGQQPSVAEQLIAEAAPQPGIAGIPVTNIGNEEAYAAGGIVAFEEGGDVQGYADGGSTRAYNRAARESFLGRGLESIDEAMELMPSPGNLYKRAGGYFADVLSGMRWVRNPYTGELVRAKDVVENPNAGALVQQPGMTNITGMMGMTQPDTSLGVPATPIPPELLKASQQGTDTGSAGKTPAGPRPPAAPSAAPTGLQTLVAPEIKYTPIPEADRTPLVDARGEMDKYMGLIGEDPYAAKAAERISKMEQANELYKQQFPWMALAEAGFGMAAGSSPFALQNIAEGGKQGITALARGRKDVQEQEEKIFNAEAKVAEAKRAVQLSAAKFGLESEQTARAARRLENAEERKNKLLVETKNKEFEFDAKKFSIEEARKQRELTAEIENKQALARYYNKTPAEIQLIERYAADKKIPFAQAFEEVQYGKNEPKTDSAIAAKLLTANPMLAEDPEALAKAVQNYKAGMSGYNPAQWGTPKQISK